MYSAEVLSKFPVVQHFRFGFLFSWDQDPDASVAPMSVHATTGAPGGSKASLESVASMQNRPQYVTKTPWVTSFPDSNANNATPRLRERRFDAIEQITKPPHMKPSSFPHQGLPNTLQLVNPEVSDSAAMPPPTRAPWATQD